MKPLYALIALALLGCDTPESTVVCPVVIERDTTTVITDTLHAPDKRCAECWDSVTVLNERILILENLIYHGGK